MIYTSEIDYYRAGESDYDLAVIELIVDDESMEVIDHSIQTYQYIYSGPDDEEGDIRFDKASYMIIPGDSLQFYTYGFNLHDPSQDDWFPAGDVITFVQEPVFWLEFLEFEDDRGDLVDYYYAIWAEDASGNATLDGPYPTQQP